MTDHDLAWLTEFLHDILGEGFLSVYQRELVGPIPPGVIIYFGLDSAEILELFG